MTVEYDIFKGSERLQATLANYPEDDLRYHVWKQSAQISRFLWELQKRGITFDVEVGVGRLDVIVH